MALQELSVSELNQVSGAVWDDVDWLGAAVTGGFGWTAADVTAAVQGAMIELAPATVINL